MQSADQQLDRLDRRMARAAIEAQRLLDQHEARAGVARVLRDSAERHRDVVAVLRAIAGTTRLSDAHRLARRYLESIA